MTSSWVNLGLAWLAGITFAGRITCSALCSPVAIQISTNNIAKLYHSFNLKEFGTEQLNEICPCMGSFLACAGVNNLIQSSSDVSCSKMHINMDLTIFRTFEHLLLSMKSICSSQCLTSGYKAWNWLGGIILSFPFVTQQITTMHIVIGILGRLLLGCVTAHSPTSTISLFLLRLLFLLNFQILLVHFLKKILIHCHQIHSVWSMISNGSQHAHVIRISATTICQYRGPSPSCFKQFCPQIVPWYFVSRIPATHTCFHLLKAL